MPTYDVGNTYVLADGFVPVGYVNGYWFDMCRPGHQWCYPNCLNSVRVRCFTTHHHAAGPWPMHYLASDFRARNFAVNRGFQLVGDPSYVSIAETDLAGLSLIS